MKRLHRLILKVLKAGGRIQPPIYHRSMYTLMEKNIQGAFPLQDLRPSTIKEMQGLGLLDEDLHVKKEE